MHKSLLRNDTVKQYIFLIVKQHMLSFKNVLELSLGKACNIIIVWEICKFDHRNRGLNERNVLFLEIMAIVVR